MKKTTVTIVLLAILLVATQPGKIRAGIVASVVEGISTEPTQILNNIELMGINIAEWTEVAQQLEQLAHEAEMIEHQLTNLQHLGYHPQDFVNSLQDLSDVVEQGQVLSYASQNINALHSQMFPGYNTYRYQNLTPSLMQQRYQTWSQQNRDNVTTALQAVNIHEETLMDEESRRITLQQLSQYAIDGNLEALQVANDLASEQTDSLHKLRQLIMVNTQLQANYMANEIDEEDLDKANWEKLSTSTPPIIGDESNTLSNW